MELKHCIFSIKSNGSQYLHDDDNYTEQKIIVYLKHYELWLGLVLYPIFAICFLFFYCNKKCAFLSPKYGLSTLSKV